MISLGDESPPSGEASPAESQPSALARRLLLGGWPPVLESEIDEGLQILSLHQMAEMKGKPIIKPVIYRKRTLQVDDAKHDVFIADDCSRVEATFLLKKWLKNPHEPLSKW